MYACICNAIRESTLRRAALACPGDAEAVYRSLDCAPVCGQCLEEANRLIETERANARLPVCVVN